jgi:probable rRNA maturation factor
MHYTIHFVPEVEARGLKTTVKQAALETLANEEAVPGSLTIVLTDEERIQRLNQEYAGIDQSTDVLAFPGAELDPDESAFYFGDIIIALPVAQRQAEQAGHAVQAEVALLTVHGTLHLLGYDHATQTEKDTMWAKQATILKSLGLDSIEAGG